MKVGIMTMHRVENYGSYLQAYGLRKVIESMGHSVEFVDYEVESTIPSQSMSRKFKTLSKIKSTFKMILPSYRKYRSQQIHLNQTFSDFCNAYRNNFLPEMDVYSKKNYCAKVDTLIIGSDEVFNCTQDNQSVGFSRQLFGKDNRANCLISYAASFGSTTLQKLNDYGIAEEIKQHLKGFNGISVRDKNSVEIVESLCNVTPIKNIDPVLLYEFPEVNDIKINEDNYIIVYAYAGRIKEDEASQIKKFAKKHNKKILCMGFYQPFCDKYILASPLEVLAYIKKADFVITDTFHGTVFSIKYQVPFATIIRDSNKEKLGDLLDTFSLKYRQVLNTQDISNILHNPINSENVKTIIDFERKQSMKYLSEFL